MSAWQRPSALAPFRVRNFRLQWPADLLTSWGFEMETLILGWYILVETNSVLLLSAFGALQYAGTLIAPMFGVAGDRIGHRNLLCGMRAAYASLAITLVAVIYCGVLSPLAVFLIAALSGAVRPSDIAVRGALVAESVPSVHLTSALSVSRTTSDSARIVGALAGAGLLVTLGIGRAYIFVATLYALGLLLTVCITPASDSAQSGDAPEVTLPRPSPWHDLSEGIGYVWTTPRLLAAMWIAFLVNLTAYPLTNGLLPYVAREVYRIDPSGLGYLVASFAFGALLGSLSLSLVGGRLRMARMMVTFAVVWFALLLAFVQTRSMGTGVALLMGAGFSQSLSLVPLSVILLRTSSQKLRGRVMGVRMLAIYGLPVGLITAGALIERLGFGVTLTAYAATGLAFVLFIGVRWRSHLWPAQAPANAL